MIIFFFQAEDGIRDYKVTGVQTCALPIEGRAGLSQLNLDTGPGGGLSKPFNFDPTQDPGYQFRLSQGETAVGSSAAAKGTQLSGGTFKRLLKFGSDYPSGGFNAAFSRRLSRK